MMEPSRQPATPVFLAQVSEDVLAERDRLIAGLQRRGVSAGPVAVYSPGSEDFAALIAEAMEGAKIFVQLLGEEDDRFAVQQLDMARARGMKIVQWASLRAERAGKNPLATGPSVMKVSLDGLEEIIVREVLGSTPPAPKFVFLDFDESDAILGFTLQNELVRRGAAVMVPPISGSAAAIHAELAEGFRHCDALVIAYQNASQMWVRAQIKLFVKLRPRRAVPVAIYSIEGAEKIGGVIPGAKAIQAKRISIDVDDGLTAGSLDQLTSYVAA
jgi:hypothetical protein